MATVQRVIVIVGCDEVLASGMQTLCLQKRYFCSSQNSDHIWACVACVQVAHKHCTVWTHSSQYA